MRGRWSVRPLDSSHNREMLTILKACPMRTARLDLLVDREPDIFLLPSLHYDEVRAGGFFRGERLVGFGFLGLERARVNGRAETVFHFTDNYLLPEARGAAFYYRASEFFFGSLPEDCRLGYGVVLEGNREMESTAGRRSRRYPLTPHSRRAGSLEVRTILVSRPRRPAEPSIRVRPATDADVPLIARLLEAEFRNRLFGPAVSEEIVREAVRERPDFSIGNFLIASRDGEAVGAASGWDNRAIRQARVVRYGPALRLQKALHGLGARVFRYPTLPAVGEAFRDLVICEYAAPDARVMRALLDAFYETARRGRCHTLTFGSHADDPRLDATRGFRAGTLRSGLYLLGPDPAFVQSGARVERPFVNLGLI